MKRILITGSNSYIGTSVECWLRQPQFAVMYQVDTVDMRGEVWQKKDFSGYAAVLHVAGIAHADVGKVTEEQKKLYYRVNCDLAVKAAEKAKESGVKQFIFMSSLIVYEDGESFKKKKVITKATSPRPSNFYGDSKLQAEKRLKGLVNEWFHIAILRPPMIYGKGCKGNYSLLSKLAKKTLIFPDIENERSMLYIGNLCEFIRLLIESEGGGLYFPQNAEYARTSKIVGDIANVHGRKIWVSKYFNIGIYLLALCPGKIKKVVNKAFGNLVCEKSISQYPTWNYQIYSMSESIKETEC